MSRTTGPIGGKAMPVWILGSDATVADPWEIVLIPDEATNDSDKTITVPVGYEYQMLNIWVELTTTATAGERQLVVEFQDVTGDVIGQLRAGEVQAESLTRYYMFGPSLADLEDFRDTDYLMTPMQPSWFLPALYQVRIYDNNAVAAAADDMVIQMLVARRAV